MQVACAFVDFIVMLKNDVTGRVILHSIADVLFMRTFAVQSICKIMGVRCSQDGRLGSALSWFLRSKVRVAAVCLINCF